jgi:predicted nucleic acid-binding Zn ribbon protein
VPTEPRDPDPRGAPEGPDGAAAGAGPGGAGPGGADASDRPHADDGLDLARSLTRATTGRSPRRRRRSDRAQPTSARTPRGDLSGAHPDERDPQLLDTSVARVVADRGWELELRVRGVFARWPELVGDDIAAHARPESFADGRLVVRTDSTAWATQLRLLAPTVVRRLNEELGHQTVTLIEVLGPRGPSWKKGPRSVRDGRGPRDTYG